MKTVRLLSFMMMLGLFCQATTSKTWAGVGGKTYNIVVPSNPLAPIRFLEPDVFESPLAPSFGGGPGNWSETDFGLFATWTGESQFIFQVQSVSLTITEQYTGFQVGPLLFASATVTVQEVPGTYRSILIALEARD